MGKQKIVFRADGDGKIGLGHISRCLALAEILSTDYDTSFALQEPDPGLFETVRKLVGEVITLKRRDSGARDFYTELESYLTGEEIVVLDGYHFDLVYEEGVKKRVRAVVAIDDIPNRRFAADLIFNFCGAVSAKDYPGEFYTQTFLGLEFLFLRSPFLRKPFGNKEYNGRLLLNMGGADRDNHTLRVLHELLSQNYPEEINVVIGNNYSHADSLDRISRNRTGITVHRGLTPKKMYDVMNACTLAIVPPSTVALEFLSTGGLTFLHQTADNQALQKKYLLDSRLAFDYADFKSIWNSPESLFQRSVSLQKKVFNGSSLEKIRDIFETLTLSVQLVLRDVTANDIELTFQWANDPIARRNSFTTDSIMWEQHKSWFGRKRTDPNCYYFIADMGKVSAGQIRFDLLDDNTFQISYMLDPRWRGKGLGYYLLIKGIQKLTLLTPVRRIAGYVQKVNSASVKAFQKAGFEMRTSKKYPDSFKFELSFLSHEFNSNR